MILTTEFPLRSEDLSDDDDDDDDDDDETKRLVEKCLRADQSQDIRTFCFLTEM